MSSTASTPTGADVPPPVFPTDWTLADLQEQLGGISADRIRLHPPPGMAVEQDVLKVQAKEGRLYELIDGVLVEKTMGYVESYLAAFIIHALQEFVIKRDLGFVLVTDAPLRILPQQVRLPDVSFFSWNRFPDRKLPNVQVLGMAPDLAIEVLSPSNTPREMQRKLEEYFAGGTRLVWYIDPAAKSAKAYASAEQCVTVQSPGKLDGDPVLPGFALDLGELFRRAAEHFDL